MKEKLLKLKEKSFLEIEKSESSENLFEIEKKYLGRNGGELNEILKGLKDLDNSQKPLIGKLSNEIKNEILEKIAEKIKSFEEKYFDEIGKKEKVDFSLPSIKKTNFGSRHPVSAYIDFLVEIFQKMGFSLEKGNEIESEWFNFTALNVGPDHPAREMQDTFFIKDLETDDKMGSETDKKLVLRTQTSSIQIHHMLKYGAPCAIICPGKVFRKDSDATHSPMFHQIEGLFVDENVSISNLKYVLLNAFREALEDDKIEMRFRLSYFPFTEPSFEVDVSCPICGGKDKTCKVCKGNNWLEIGGAGMVHPNVLKNAGIDSKKYSGFAFGFGIDRLVMIKHKIDDIRLLYQNNLKFLEQF